MHATHLLREALAATAIDPRNVTAMAMLLANAPCTASPANDRNRSALTRHAAIAGEQPRASKNYMDAAMGFILPSRPMA